VLAEQAEAERVQRTAGDLVGRGAQVAPESRGDLVGGLVGEGDRADAAGGEAHRADQMGDPSDEAEGLAGPRPRQHEDGS
jgi:hypothetical protein